MVRTSPGAPIRDNHSVTLVELVVSLTVTALALTFSVSRLSARPYFLTADHMEMAANFRVAREYAQSRTSAYRVRIVSQRCYVVDRGHYNPSLGTWEFPVTDRTVDLRGDVEFAFDNVGRSAQFDTRGWLVGSSVTFTMQDSSRSETRDVVVYRTGIIDRR